MWETEREHKDMFGLSQYGASGTVWQDNALHLHDYNEWALTAMETPEEKKPQRYNHHLHV